MNVVVLVVASAATLYAFLTMPTWLGMSVNRSSLWKLRDEMFDARRRGELPDVDAVERRIRLVERCITMLPTLTPFTIAKLLRGIPEGYGNPGELGEPVQGVDGPAAAKLQAFDLELGRLLTRHYLSGSWSGITFAVLVGDLRRLLFHVSTKQRFDEDRRIPAETEKKVDWWRDDVLKADRAERLGFNSRATPTAA
jgi:hypothetical protein